MRKFFVLLMLVASVIATTAASVAAQEQGCTPLLTTTTSGSMWSFPGCTAEQASDWLAAVEAAQTAQPTSVPETVDPNEFFIEISGVRSSVPMTEVDHARGGFSSPWPFLSQVLAEPGKLVVGPDFAQADIDESSGAIWRTDPLNTYRLEEQENIGCAEGAFVFISVQEANLASDNFAISFRAPDGDGAHVYIRCENSDHERGSDAGNDIAISGYEPNKGSVIHFSGQPVGGFVSAGGAQQALDIATSATSSGSEGANRIWIITIDSNTGAISVAVWDGSTMELEYTNWWVS